MSRGDGRARRRVLAVAEGSTPLPGDVPEDPLADLQPLGLVVLAEELRPNVNATIAFLREQEVEIKVLSGDAPETVAAVARDVGIPVAGVSDGSSIPEDPEARRRFAADVTVVGRISPDGKQAIVRALADGVNDVPALKSARLAIAQGSGTQMARGTRIEHRSRRHGRTSACRTHSRAPPTDTRTRHGYQWWRRLRRSGHEQRSRACD